MNIFRNIRDASRYFFRLEEGEMERCLEGGQVGERSRLSDDDMSMIVDNNQAMSKGVNSRKNSTFGLGQRRNSSFADFFEEGGDFGQSLLSRRHFTWSHDEREGRGGKRSNEENFSVNDPGIFVNSSCNQKTKETSTKKKLSKVQKIKRKGVNDLFFSRFCRRTGFSATLTLCQKQ